MLPWIHYATLRPAARGPAYLQVDESLSNLRASACLAVALRIMGPFEPGNCRPK